MRTCELCGAEFKNAAGLAAHARFKHQPEEAAPPVNTTVIYDNTTTTTTNTGTATFINPSTPTIIPEWDNERAPLKVTVIGREITLLRPVCKLCQRGRHTRPQWWLTCKHNPYVTIAPVETEVPKYVDTDDDGNPLPPGRQRLVGTEKFVEWVERPNRVQLSFNRRIGSGNAVDRARRTKGFIFPEELRTPMYPNGVANTCEFRDCFAQTDLKDYRWGRFCRAIEARLVGHDIRQNGGGGALEVGTEPQNIEKQRMQLESVPI